MKDENNELAIGRIEFYSATYRMGFLSSEKFGELPFMVKYIEPEKNQMVGFRRVQSDGFFDVEAVDVRPIWRYTDEILTQYEYHVHDPSILRSSSRLFYKYVDYWSRRRGLLPKILNVFEGKMDHHVKSTKIDYLIDNYKVKLIEGGSKRPGKDDSANITIGGVFYDPNYEISEKYGYDKYIRELFPTKKNGEVFRTVYSERAFTSYVVMLHDYKSDLENWKNLQSECQDIEREVKANAKKKYNQKTHLETIRHDIKTRLNEARISLVKELSYKDDYGDLMPKEGEGVWDLNCEKEYLPHESFDPKNVDIN